jgi:glutamate-ammonia-ligase adenylyltransferase
LWEAQALTKARPVSGPQQAEWSDAARKIWRQFGECDDLFSEIAAMHERVVRERAAGGDRLDFKTGTGGLMQLEFFTQAQQMRRAIWEPGTCAALARLADVGAIDRGVAASLSAAYLQLRRVEAALRRVDDTGESRLPADEAGQRRVAWRAGFVSLEACLAAYDGAREVIRQDAPLGG